LGAPQRAHRPAQAPTQPPRDSTEIRYGEQKINVINVLDHLDRVPSITLTSRSANCCNCALGSE